MSLLDAALEWHQAGCCVMPAKRGKRPLYDWKLFQQQRPDEAKLSAWYRMHREPGDELGVGIICGAVSGNLEMLELEGRATTSEALDRIAKEVLERNLDDTWNRLLYHGYCEWTPSGGVHLLYRINDHPVPGNTKVACRPATAEELESEPKNKIRTLAETRGEGGYVVVAPTGGNIHPTGSSWVAVSGSTPHTIPTITWEQRCALHEAIHVALDEMPPPVAYATLTPRSTDSSDTLDASRPGDDFQMRATWEEILEPHGWRIHHRTNQETFWTRPGKDRRDGWSATTGYAGDGAEDRLYVWSSSTEFDIERPYNKFQALAVLEFNNDFSATARALRQRGFGAPAAVEVALAAPTWHTPVPAPSEGSMAGQRQAVTWRDAVPAPDLFRRFRYTARGAGDMFAELYHPYMKFSPKEGTWYAFNGKVWERDDLAWHEEASKALLDFAHEEAQRRTAAGEDQATELRRFVTKLENSTAPTASRWGRSDSRVTVKAEDFDRRRHLVTVNNGVLDLRSGELLPHDPSFLNTKLIPIDHDPEAKAPQWEQFLNRSLPDPQLQEYLQRAIGHTLLGEAEQRALFLLWGDSGTGKSQFIKMMELVFGDFAETAAPATFMASSRGASLTNDLNDLQGARFVSISETDQDERLHESLIKRVTGGDTVKSRALYQGNTSWRPTFTLWMASNFPPPINSDDNAMWRRLKPIHFAHVAKHNGGEIPRLAEKIFEEEAAGVLNWVLEGVRKYREHGLEDIPQVVEAVNRYREENDGVIQFLQDSKEEGVLALEPQATITVRHLHKLYVDWCRDNNQRSPLGERRFGRRLEAQGYSKKVVAAGRAWVGIGIGKFGALGTMFTRT